MAVNIQLRRGNASEWTSANPVLMEGELGLELDTGKYKIGNGSTAWNSLSYSSLPSTAISNTVVNAKGDLIVGTADDTVDRLAVGTDGYILTASAAATTGLVWQEMAAGADVLQVQVFS